TRPRVRRGGPRPVWWSSGQNRFETRHGDQTGDAERDDHDGDGCLQEAHDNGLLTANGRWTVRRRVGVYEPRRGSRPRCPTPPTASRRNRQSQASLLSSTWRIDPNRPSRARIRPGSSATGSQDRGHQPPSRTAWPARTGARCSRAGEDGGDATIMARWMSLVVMAAVLVVDP